jgi:hypothetical protein
VVEHAGGRRAEEWSPLQDEDVTQVVRLLGLDRPEAALELQRALAARRPSQPDPSPSPSPEL